MRILIAGGTGFIGQALCQHFLTNRHQVVVLGRNQQKIINLCGDKVSPMSWEMFTTDKQKALKDIQLVINLVGANIAEKRWTPQRKQELIESRVKATYAIANQCAKFGKASPPLFNASAVGIYGLQKPISQTLPLAFDETTNIDFDSATDFVSSIVREWEKATFIARDQQVRVVNMRFAVVLGRQGLLEKLTLPYSLGLGGPIGSGLQPFAWIALEDLIRGIDFLIEQTNISGPVNFVSPTCISQSEFAKAFGKALRRPALLRTPAFLLKLIYGEMAEELLLNGQCAYPRVLLSNGFDFNFPTIDKILQNLFS